MISFREFFVAADPQRRPPYPWQEALAERLAGGAPPRAIVVPTGGGKTATIEALIWALAMQADHPPRERTVGVRTVWAIDRRILVDEVYERAVRLGDRLRAATDDDILYEVAQRLRSLAGPGTDPLRVSRWRGGLASESRAHHPRQPEVITSTVAQIGSRLLFRGYGVGTRSLALEAGLAAVDTTICLDEAHLAEPFRQTVEAIRAIRAAEPVGLPGLHAITLTATPVGDLRGADIHTIGDADRAALGPRLTGRKVARLVQPASDSAVDQLAALVDAVEQQLDAGAPTIACVVNTVRTAIDVRAAIARRRPDVALALLIGPQRQADRDELLGRYRGQLFDRVRGDEPLVCVATQTFEVGLDADVDALVTQSASATALVQRLGRLNRAGVGVGSATIVRDVSAPLYAVDEAPTWEWLRSRAQPDGTIDVSVAALLDDGTRPAPARSRSAPELTPETLELLVQTAPRPARMADPDVEVFLRGAEEPQSSDVGLCWRCDLRLDDDSPSGRSCREALLRLMAPARDEVVAVGIARAHQLLRAMRAPRSLVAALAKAALDAPDVEGADQLEQAPELQDAQREEHAPGRIVVLRGREYLELSLDGEGAGPQDLHLRDVRPGDVLVLPSTAGGYAHGALSPMSRAAVADVASDMLAGHDASRSRAVMRLTEEALGLGGLDSKRILKHAAQVERAPSQPALEELCELLGPAGAQLRAHGTLELRRISVDTETHFGDLDIDDLAFGLGDDASLLPGERAPASSAFVLMARDEATPEEVRTAVAPPPTLDDHARTVARLARTFVDGSGLPEGVANAVVLAARAHDHGKADPRFQAFFRGGVPAFAGAPIAKSVFGTADVQASRAARSAAGLPRGLRHEIASVSALACALATGRVSDLPSDVDRGLALHLVATHHGLGRPVPAVPEPSSSTAREFVADAAGIASTARGDAVEGWDAGAWTRRFFATIDRYGPWGTAYLEALLMLADRVVSRKGD